MTILTVKAQQDHLQKVASTRDPVKALAEFVWNALDADATAVDVEFERNALGGLEAIVIRDTGNGISHKRATQDFENVGASWKRQARRTRKQRAVHGKEGQGRLRFFSLARKALWDSCYEEEGQRFRLAIEISADALKTADVSDPESTSDCATGTVLRLGPLKETFDWLTDEEMRSDFSAIFAPYLLQYPDVTITYDGRRIDPTTTIDRAMDFPAQVVICPNRVVKDVTIKVIEWKVNVERRKIHFGGESGVVLGSQAANVTAPDFNFSAYAYSPFFQEIADANLLDFDGLNDPDFTRVVDYVRETLTDYFRMRQAERSGELIEELKAAGVYPYVGDPKDAVESRERQVFDIATHAVSSYSREFKKADNSLKKMTLSLLREAIRHNPESISNILHAVFNLPKNRQDEFAGLLNKTALASIISASSLIADRVVLLEVLKGIVFDPKHRRTVKERGELDILIRDNTWVFGENFHITLAERGLTKVMARVSQELAIKTGSKKTRKPDGKIGRVDSFLGRVVPYPDKNHREFLLLELKRPSLRVGRKELDQLEDYVNAIKSQPDFINTQTDWNFFLVTGEYDDAVRERITQSGRPVGLFLEKPNHKVWVKSWAELIRECEARLHFIQEQLQIEVTTEEIEDRISHLKSSILRGEKSAQDASEGSAGKSHPEAGTEFQHRQAGPLEYPSSPS
ncbi:ATP-binding protein [Aurantimonas marina]|uniref:ATP-binding protein n=1 Tax=Aurantimonas marina TaxID=2780508 RepID=UPI0019D090F8|nr:ATP-binding protein [Aurantimonas marina]